MFVYPTWVSNIIEIQRAGISAKVTKTSIFSWEGCMTPDCRSVRMKYLNNSYTANFGEKISPIVHFLRKPYFLGLKALNPICSFNDHYKCFIVIILITRTVFNKVWLNVLAMQKYVAMSIWERLTGLDICSQSLRFDSMLKNTRVITLNYSQLKYALN